MDQNLSMTHITICIKCQRNHRREEVTTCRMPPFQLWELWAKEEERWHTKVPWVAMTMLMVLLQEMESCRKEQSKPPTMSKLKKPVTTMLISKGVHSKTIQVINKRCNYRIVAIATKWRHQQLFQTPISYSKMNCRKIMKPFKYSVPRILLTLKTNKCSVITSLIKQELIICLSNCLISFKIMQLLNRLQI